MTKRRSSDSFEERIRELERRLYILERAAAKGNIFDDDVHTGFIQINEDTTALAAPGDALRLGARDNGSGKTQFYIRFSTGVVQVIAQQQ